MSKEVDMTIGSPTQHILRFALPLVAAGIGQQIYLIIDAAIIGHVLGMDAFAAVGATDWCCWTLLWIIQFMTHGFAACISNAFGEGNEARLQKTIVLSMRICAIVGCAVSIIGPLGTKNLLRMMQTPDSLLPGACTYLYIISGGAIVITFYHMSLSILRAFGNWKTPVLAVGMTAFFNIGLDYLFVACFQLEFAGAAVATILSQLISTVFCVCAILRIRPLRFKSELFSGDKEIVRQLCQSGFPLAAQQLLIGAAGLVFQSAVNIYGAAFIAGCTATNKLFGLLEASALSLGDATTTYLAQNDGAGKHQNVCKGIKTSLKMSVLVSVIVFTIVYCSGTKLLMLFLNNNSGKNIEAIEYGMRFLLAIAFHLPVLYLLDMFRAIMQGCRKSKSALLSGIVESAVKVVVSIGLTTVFGREILFYSEPLSWSISLLLSAAIIYRIFTSYAKASKEASGKILQ